MKKLTLIALLISFNAMLFGQDKIILVDDRIVMCEITSVTNNDIHIILNPYVKPVPTLVKQDQVKEISVGILNTSINVSEDLTDANWSKFKHKKYKPIAPLDFRFVKDEIVMHSGQVIECNISSITDTLILFSYDRNGKAVNTFTVQSEIKGIVVSKSYMKKQISGELSEENMSKIKHSLSRVFFPDIIFRKQNHPIKCEINSITADKVFFKYLWKEDTIQTSISQSEIEMMIIDEYREKLLVNDNAGAVYEGRIFDTKPKKNKEYDPSQAKNYKFSRIQLKSGTVLNGKNITINNNEVSLLITDENTGLKIKKSYDLANIKTIEATNYRCTLIGFLVGTGVGLGTAGVIQYYVSIPRYENGVYQSDSMSPESVLFVIVGSSVFGAAIGSSFKWGWKTVFKQSSSAMNNTDFNLTLNQDYGYTPMFGISHRF